MRVDRQWWMVGSILGLIALLIGSGWLVRDRFAPVEVGSVAPDFAATDLAGEPVRHRRGPSPGGVGAAAPDGRDGPHGAGARRRRR